MDSAILTVLIILIATVVMLVFEFVRIEMAALLSMLVLGWTGVLTPHETFSGFSSNAVIAMMAVMILGQGIAKTGIMDRFSQAVLRKVGTNKSKVIGVMSLSVGMLSGLIQNIGAAALGETLSGAKSAIGREGLNYLITMGRASELYSARPEDVAAHSSVINARLDQEPICFKRIRWRRRCHAPA